MQRVLLLLSTLFALYACTGTVPHKAMEEKPAEQVTEELAGGLPGAEEPEEIPEDEGPPVLPIGEPLPHIALLLPMQSPIFGTAAEAVHQGFMASARYNRQALPIRVYSDFDESASVIAAYRQAIANGAVAVVGPLTRNGVTALAERKRIPVPTLALNIVDTEPAPNMFFFGMSIESEARQAAKLAKQQGLHQAIIVTVGNSLSQRLQAAFEEEWSNTDHGILREIEFNNDHNVFTDITDISDTVVFLAADAAKARRIRPYLPNKLPVYSSSQIFSGNENTLTNYDLNGIRFVDMPWLLQPDHPAVMVYQRADPPLPIDRERLYALGIDAFRLARLMIAGNAGKALPIDGVSGRIRLNGHIFQREAVPAKFVEGQARLGEAPYAPGTTMFPGRESGQESDQL